ncbi:MAG: hypothetical protein GOMPHAMPRED_005777 [Gomphillus americanus]|uniref:Uncharacterized protein n=1 Tax=Gomphillus americanus TaxID=1940652 RepID=A0A8H3IWD4_9LECA|nr:MAG: hypothetical protein GOMPHAMPRED_005777 [Gomphillus americanus]
MASFESFPNEIQREILLHHLVVPRQPMGISQGLAVYDGQAKIVQPGIFLVNKAIRRLAQETALAENRIILMGKPEKNLSWLEAQSIDILHRIKRLDLVITPAQFCDYSLLKGWNQLVGALQRKLMLKNLRLSIDSCLTYVWSFEKGSDLLSYQAFYDIILEPFTPSFSALKDFFILWPCWQSLESIAEKQVKGAAYDSIQRGKIAYYQRDYRMVHGWEWEKFDKKGEFLPEYKKYREIRIVGYDPRRI